MICAVLYSNTIQGLEDQAKKALAFGVGIIEYRLDGLTNINIDEIKKLIEQVSCKSIISLKSEWKDQNIIPPEQGRKELLRKFINLKPDFIDLEYPIDMTLLNEVKEPTKAIISMLDFEGMSKIAITPVTSLAIENKGTIVKISATPSSVANLSQLWRWSNHFRKLKITNIVLGMGQLGQISRIKSRELGNLWTYGRISNQIGEPLLPGMLHINELNEVFSEEAWHLGALGMLPEHNILRSLFAKILEKADLKGIFLNIPIKNYPELDQMLLWIDDGLLDGLFITSPWQNDIRSKLNHLDVSVVWANKCNCVAITKDGLTGYNTEIEGIKRCLEPYSLRRFKRIYIEGTERYIRSVISAIKDNAETIVIRSNNQQLINEIKVDFRNIVSAKDSFTEHFDLVVNCCEPETGFENIVTIPPRIIENAKVIFDPVSKLETRNSLIIKANELNIPTVDAWSFFINTAIRSFEIWTKRSISSSSLNINDFKIDELNLDFMNDK